jgi:hypothetical protein
VKDEVGITHEDELVQALVALTDKIHPLAIGNVQRSHHQSRLLARKLLRLHMLSESQEHEIERLIDTLKSNLFYHGHPINRSEAKDDLKLTVVEPPTNVENAMWQLYLEYEQAMTLNEPFNAVREMELKAPPPAARTPLTTKQIVDQIKALASEGVGLPGVNEQQLIGLAAAMIPFVSGGAAASGKVKLDALVGAYIESSARADVFKTDLRLERTSVNTPSGPQEATKQEVIWQRWEQEK